jgi:hypothetical protein
MVTSTNKGYELQVDGTNTGTWGNVLNDDVIEIIDNNLGGSDSVALAASNVALTALQSQYLALRFTGTLTANVIVTTECIGMTMIENNTTGNFTVTFRNNVNANGVVVPQSQNFIVLSTAAEGCRIVARTYTVGTIASQNANAVAITGGTIAGLSSPLALADGGTGNVLADPGADRIMFWDDSSGEVDWLTPSTNLTVTGTNLTADAYALSLQSAVTTTSGTEARFTSIPSWVKQITIMFTSVSFTGGDELQLQLGTSSGYKTSGYTGVVFGPGGSSNTSDSFPITNDSTSGANTFSGAATLTNFSGNTWVISGTSNVANSGRAFSGFVTLSSVLDRLRFIPSGSNSFDGGTVNVMYA